MVSPSIRLASFDIFDTVLIRKCGSPENLFYVLSKRLFPDNKSLQADFYIWRLHAEEKAMSKVKESSLSDIYSSLPEHISKSSDIENIADLEFACLADGINVLNSVSKIYFHYGTLVRKIYEYLRETF